MRLNLVSFLLFIFASSASNIAGETSVIKFEGNVVVDTRSLASASKNQSVPLGDVSANAFTGTGTTTRDTAFSIVLDDCDITIAKTSTIWKNFLFQE
jgi:major type 1 subunit fimbrin (pilin)